MGDDVRCADPAYAGDQLPAYAETASANKSTGEVGLFKWCDLDILVAEARFSLCDEG